MSRSCETSGPRATPQDSKLTIENWNTPAVKAEVRGTRVVRNTGAIDAYFENSYLDFSYHEHPPSNFWAPVTGAPKPRGTPP